jgi:hypothetical protein
MGGSGEIKSSLKMEARSTEALVSYPNSTRHQNAEDECISQRGILNIFPVQFLVLSNNRILPSAP